MTSVRMESNRPAFFRSLEIVNFHTADFSEIVFKLTRWSFRLYRASLRYLLDRSLRFPQICCRCPDVGRSWMVFPTGGTTTDVSVIKLGVRQ